MGKAVNENNLDARLFNMDATVLSTLQKSKKIWLLKVKQRALQNVGCYRFCEKRGNERVGSTTIVHKLGGLGRMHFVGLQSFGTVKLPTHLHYVSVHECTFLNWTDADF
jgi:hypothetical protein